MPAGSAAVTGYSAMRRAPRGLMIALIAVLAGTLSSEGRDVRATSEAEIADLLFGCWRMELPTEQSSWELDACFGADGTVATRSLTFSTHHGRSEYAGRGTYVLADGKLVLRGSEDDQGWIFNRAELSCDALVAPQRAIKLMNCTDHRDVLPDMSYAYLDSGTTANE